MNVLFIAQCNKRALTETRRILDQFAERRGERTWQTPITQAGLDTVRKLLRQTARKNTAVACHWIRGRDHSELLWVVGDASQFNDQGAVPTNTTASNVLRADDENAWHQLPLMTALAALAALLHDLGKATQAFQDKLKTPVRASATTTAMNGCRYGSSRPLWGRTMTRAGCNGWRPMPTRTPMRRLWRLSGWTMQADGCCAMGWMSPRPSSICRSPACRRWPRRWRGWCSPTTACPACR